jgi:hypothetical protein
MNYVGRFCTIVSLGIDGIANCVLRMKAVYGLHPSCKSCLLSEANAEACQTLVVQPSTRWSSAAVSVGAVWLSFFLREHRRGGERAASVIMMRIIVT